MASILYLRFLLFYPTIGGFLSQLFAFLRRIALCICLPNLRGDGFVTSSSAAGLIEQPSQPVSQSPPPSGCFRCVIKCFRRRRSPLRSSSRP
ncbi:uncharacterized protein [Coffea arabica]|uniref:Uncharacterized protein LOC113738236 isoform X3 n=1 Tax=Coffea arabica TaxID=13443 RepID=A0A6P6X2W9_COFAR|nr:uncharacterized protein LOC113738236 isoform X3 [Coffea arabica]